MMTHSLGDIATATRIERERQVDELDAHDRCPERRHPEPRLGFRRRTAALAFLAVPEVRVHEIEKVEPARQLHPGDLNEIDGQQGGQDAKNEGSDQAVLERPLALVRETLI